jgi:quinol monooxygenase YgiN
MVKLALLARVEAKPGKEEEVAEFLRNALPLAEGEPGTVSWFAFRIGSSTFGIFDTFNDEAGRQAHLSGPIAAALMAKASELLAKPPVIEQLDLLAGKTKD